MTVKIDEKPEAKAEAKPDASKAWETEKAELTAKLATSEAARAAAKAPKPAETPPAKPQDFAAERTRLDVLEKRDAVRELAAKNGLSLEQAEKVHEIATASPQLKPSEHLIIAKARDPELWKETHPAGAQGFHGSARPSGGGGPPAEPDPIKRLIKSTREAPTRIERDNGLATICGVHMAKAMGFAHPAAR